MSATVTPDIPATTAKLTMVHLVRTHLAATVAPVAKMCAVTSVVAVSPVLLAASANLNWEYDYASRIHVETTAFAWR